jgi:hypothetical protein
MVWKVLPPELPLKKPHRFWVLGSSLWLAPE